LVQESRTLGLLTVATVNATPELSQALPTQSAAREYAKAEPEVREVIKEIIKEDPDAEIKAAQIKRLSKELAELNAQQERLATEAIEGRIAMNDRDKLREQLNALTIDSSAKELEAARKEADALLNTIQTLDRQIMKLSTNVFTHNDPQFIQQLGNQLEELVSNYNYKSDQVATYSSESSSDYSSGATGSEVRIIDVTYAN
jgi:gas vesicle protein